jgi:hypothetical protein
MEFINKILTGLPTGYGQNDLCLAFFNYFDKHLAGVTVVFNFSAAGHDFNYHSEQSTVVK